MTDLYQSLTNDIIWEGILKLKHENSRKNIKLQNFPKESIETAFENIELTFRTKI